MNLQRKLTLMVTTVGVAFGAGHFVQKRAETRQPADNQLPKITALAPVAAGPEALAAPALDFRPPLPAEAAPIEPTLPETNRIEAKATPIAEPEPGPAPAPAPTAAQTTLAAADPAELIPSPPSVTTPPASLPVPVTPNPVATTPAAPAEVESPMVPATAPSATAETTEPAPEMAQSCDVTFDLVSQPGAMIGLTVLAPCNPQERVVLWHAGLAVTAKTSSTGSLFTSLPALTEDATVEVRFASGERVAQSIQMPEAKDFRRFAVQWQDADAFQLHAFEGGAGYGQPGHYSAAFTGTAGQGSFVSILGDAATDLPLLAEVFTFGLGRSAEVVVEASVTETTCGRTIFGEMIAAEAGKVDIQDLTLAMPECEGLGDILVLKNLMQDMKLAAAK